ncbi:PASTA domain-containing protein [Acanthopleuribacter pedis]|uniref:PASTA domain-containing protein n=1 Tax=Acanthopleuribacter pedis TaxID=442870 RepID=A0A8J7U506_9BACT|nr:PASTA domain-containing protein [Acanthopleuribacter pedis]MBO1318831.1 PASTA domain-containing protein [Acanthopleuribacter pedis]
MAFRKTLTKLLLKTFLVVLGCCFFGVGAVAGTWFYLRHMVAGRVVEVPDLYDLPRDEAVQILKDHRLVVVVDEDAGIHSSAVKAGRVLLQIPRPGQRVKEGREIEMILSAGEEVKAIPQLVGESLGFSQTLLERADSKVALISRIPTNSNNRGRILAQHPEPGGDLGIRSGVSLLVSDGQQAEWYVMPDLAHRDYAEVKTFLDKHEFRVVTKYKSFDRGLGQVVLEQRPHPGYPINKNQNITLVVNRDH